MITKECLQVPRTPASLARFVKTRVRIIKAAPVQLAKARLRNGPYKVFREEIIPLSQFCPHRFPSDDVRVRPVIGTQAYDAEVFDFAGRRRAVIELVSPIDGPLEKKIASAMNDKGRFIYDCSSQQEEIEAFIRAIERLKQAAKKKALRDYRVRDGAAILVIAMNHPPPHDTLRSVCGMHWAAFVTWLATVPFQCDEVYVLMSWVGTVIRIK